jgi:hypothetical protein
MIPLYKDLVFIVNGLFSVITVYRLHDYKRWFTVYRLHVYLNRLQNYNRF